MKVSMYLQPGDVMSTLDTNRMQCCQSGIFRAKSGILKLRLARKFDIWHFSIFSGTKTKFLALNLAFRDFLEILAFLWTFLRFLAKHCSQRGHFCENNLCWILFH